MACDAPTRMIEATNATLLETFVGMDYIAVLGSEREVLELKPDFAKLKELDGCGVIITARGETSDFVSRFFAPKYGIDEDPVTGSAHCALAPYWGKKLGKTTLNAKQLSRRGGEIECELKADRVTLKGYAAKYMSGEIEI